ncbi:multicopper oxidase domain-containing protein [Kribbella sp. NPDC026596]|uniref:multicopper oxidase domain-containing protein n=1 Tax=Kribbella sp. NPDC026596 TaxID=3155122 RepID=UPI0033EC3D3B
MRTTVHRGARVLLVLVLAVFGLTCVGGSATAAIVAIELCAVPGTAPLPGGGTVPIWGFGTPTTPGNCATATASLPGPKLEVTAGDVVTITVRNALPAGHVLSFEIPGVTFDPGPTDAAPGAAVSRSFTAQPGTYLYQSGGDAGRQEAMGLSGALLVHTTTTNQAYASATTAYDIEAVLVLTAVDPAFNAAPATFDLQNFRATYWFVNGTSYPGTPPIAAAAGQRVLLRYLNAGYDNTSMTLLGTHQQVVARDARLLTNPFSASTETIPAGATEDTIVVVPAGTPPSSHGFPLFNRQLHLTNGPQLTTSPTPLTGGGMVVFIQP